MEKNDILATLEETLAANRGGKVKNLLFTDANTDFLDMAYSTLCEWIEKKGFNLVEIDEADDGWIAEVQLRELFFKLNAKNTVLLIRNYAMANWGFVDENNPDNFLRDAVVNRHYGCGNDFVPCDDLPNLLFAVAINPLGFMFWDNEEIETFEIFHENNNQRMWVNPATKGNWHSVLSKECNEELYVVSDDFKTLVFDAGKARIGLINRMFRRQWSERHVQKIFELGNNQKGQSVLNEYIPAYFENEIPDFYASVERLTVKDRPNVAIMLNAARILKVFPNLKEIVCPDIYAVYKRGVDISVKRLKS